MTDVTHILCRIESGDQQATEQLLPVVYRELRRLAQAKLRNERPDHTLQATGLVHEAYLRLVGPKENSPSWNGRSHFFAAAAEAMRRILVEAVRRKHSLKRSGRHQRIKLSDVDAEFFGHDAKLLALHEALEHLDELDPVKSNLVKLRFFAGMTQTEAAEALGISLSTAERHWAFARAWLKTEMDG
ncbi:MAG: sigma-70 family RNA polymerase sigma factor [Planctomycetales bacterium]|nr:sigma-70 family RNA polymerase sigma factor [Planctomycetales bacterium]